MEKFTLDKVTLSVILDTRRAKEGRTTEKGGKEILYFPVKYRITLMQKQYYYPSGIDLTEDEWKRLSGTKETELKDNRELIQAGFDKIKEHIKTLVKNEGFTIEGLKTRLGRGKANSVITAFNAKVDELKKQGKIGTADWYFYSLNVFQKFAKRDLRFSEITVSWLNSFEAHLLKDDKSYTSVSMYMRALRSIMNSAKKAGEITEAQYPFGSKENYKYEIPEGEGRSLALTTSQIGKLMAYPLTSDIEKRSRDLWFFSYMCNGINNNDLLRLKFKNIVNGEIRWYRQKTINTSKQKKEIAATLLPAMEQIINKWGSKEKGPNSYIFPFLIDEMSPVEARTIIKNHTSLQNKKMRAIGRALGFGDISSYWARHSFATVLKRSGVNIAFISESLGHSDIKTTESYLDRFENEERAKNAALLVNFNE